MARLFEYLIIRGLLFIGLPVLLIWLRTWEVPAPGQWIYACTLYALGLEAMFAAFLVSVLDLRRESQRTG